MWWNHNGDMGYFIKAYGFSAVWVFQWSHTLVKAGLFKLESWLKGQKGNFRANSSFSFRAYSFRDDMSVSIVYWMPYQMWSMQMDFILWGSFYVSSLKNSISHFQLQSSTHIWEKHCHNMSILMDFLQCECFNDSIL